MFQVCVFSVANPYAGGCDEAVSVAGPVTNWAFPANANWNYPHASSCAFTFTAGTGYQVAVKFTSIDVSKQELRQNLKIRNIPCITMTVKHGECNWSA